ncbi:MAG TPA: triple tyrosine motif-containing protein [Saprospiraceae bacterium]|nr:triple tyrosine motif-containing protein [Saprospiraceae bacterium]
MAEVGRTLEIPIESIAAEHGLSQGMINDVAEDREGFLWVATKDGLNRYDGTGFHVFRNDPDDPHSIAQNFISSVFVDSRNLVWVGTNASGLELFEHTTGRFIHFGITANHPTGSRILNVNHIKEDAFGNIIIQNEDGSELEIFAVIQHTDSGQHISCQVYKFEDVYPGLKDLPFPFNAKQILGFRRDSTLWYRENDDLYRINSEGWVIAGKTVAGPLSEDHSDPGIRGLPYFFDSAFDNIYFADSENNIHQLDFGTGLFEPILKIPSDYSILHQPLFVDRQSHIWVHQKDGNMLRVSLSDGQLNQVQINRDNTEKLKGRPFKIVCQDKHYNLWGSTNGHGLVKISSRNDKLMRVPSNSVDQYGGRVNFQGRSAVYYYTRDVITACKDRMRREKTGIEFIDVPAPMSIDNRGNFWTSAISKQLREGYLIRIHPSGSMYDIMASMPYDSSAGFAVPVFSDLRGEIWFGERYSGKSVRLFHLNQKTGRVEEHFFPVEVIQNDHHFISDWFITGDNEFWLGTKQGLFFFNPVTYQWKHYRFDRDDPQSLSHNYVITLCPDPEQPDRYLWVGTDGGGINKFDCESGKCIRYSTKDGLPNNIIYGIQSDHHHNLWISTNYGLSLFNPKTLEFQNFTTEDGLPGNEFNRHDYCKSDDGHLFFSGVDGAIYFDPEKFYETERPSLTVINKLKLSNKEVAYFHADLRPPSDGFRLPAPIELCRELVFPYGERMFTFGFTTLDLTNPGANRFKYRLEGFNTDWINAGTMHEATYTNLNPGKYTFQVLGCNSANVWNPEPTALQITILPPWWGTWWFRMLVLSALAGGIYVLYHYRHVQQIKLLTIRNRIATDLHDEIGSTLSSISIAGSVIQKKMPVSSSEVTSLLQQISNNTDNMMEAMSDIVWAVNAKNDRFDNVINRMRAFAIEILEPRDIRIHFAASDHVNNLLLDMQQRKNLYLIFKEAIHNAAKYADCKNVWVDISFQNGRMTMNVKDDGRGFKVSHSGDVNTLFATGAGQNERFGGNGLNNMQKRAREIRGKLNIDTSPGHGTSVQISFVP